MNQIEQIGPVVLAWSARMDSDVLQCSNFRKMVFCIMLLVSTFLVSCSSDDEYSFRSPDDALHKYQNYASVLHDESTHDTDGLIDAVCHWQ